MQEPETIEIDGLEVRIIRSRRKTLSLEITHEGVKARAPLRMRLRSISEFVQHKRQWIIKHLHCVPKPLAPIALITGARLLLEGEQLSLTVQRDAKGVARMHTVAGERQLVLPVKSSHLDIEVSTKNKLVRWYKKTACERLEQRRAFYAEQMAVPTGKRGAIKVREYKRRWGSCDANGDLSFNWRIIMAPPAVLDYVVIHELAHCHEFNHSPRFWQIVEQQMPNWRHQQDWLQNHGVELYRF